MSKSNWRPYTRLNAADRRRQMLQRGFCPHCEIRVESKFHDLDCPGWSAINTYKSLHKDQDPPTIEPTT